MTNNDTTPRLRLNYQAANGHYYDQVQPGVSWNAEHRDDCAACASEDDNYFDGLI